MKRLTLARFFLLLLAIPLPAQRAIPDDNLGYPVLINLSKCGDNGEGSGSGSGFYMNTGSDLYLVTARHVIFNINPGDRLQPSTKPSPQCKQANLTSYSKDPNEKKQNRLHLDLETLNIAGNIKAHPARDIAVVHVATTNAATPGTQVVNHALDGVSVDSMSSSGVVETIPTVIKRFADVLTGNDVYVFGYPTSIGLQQAPQIDYSAPLLRRGLIAGTNDNNKTIVLDCTVFFGNSGGPVLQVVPVGLGKRFDVIGVISQYVPFTETWINQTMRYGNMQMYNSGYAIAEPMDGVLEIVAAPPQGSSAPGKTQ